MTSLDTTIQMSSQPDRIPDDSRDLPDPIRAARRIRAYLTGAGGGLYDTADPGDGHPRPLYARDLESVARAANRPSARYETKITQARLRLRSDSEIAHERDVDGWESVMASRLRRLEEANSDGWRRSRLIELIGAAEECLAALDAPTRMEAAA